MVVGFFTVRHCSTRVEWYRHHHCFSSERHQPAGKTTNGFSVGTQGLWKQFIICYSSSCFPVLFCCTYMSYSVKTFEVFKNSWMVLNVRAFISRGSKFQSRGVSSLSELAVFVAVVAKQRDVYLTTPCWRDIDRSTIKCSSYFWIDIPTATQTLKIFHVIFVHLGRWHVFSFDLLLISHVA